MIADVTPYVIKVNFYFILIGDKLSINASTMSTVGACLGNSMQCQLHRSNINLIPSNQVSVLLGVVGVTLDLRLV